jgi:hypothetical protein
VATVLGKLMCPNGKYIKDGEEKTSWLRCGILLQTDNGMRVKLESLPLHAPEGGLWLSVFEDDKPKADGFRKAPAAADDTPF